MSDSQIIAGAIIAGTQVGILVVLIDILHELRKISGGDSRTEGESK